MSLDRTFAVNTGQIARVIAIALVLVAAVAFLGNWVDVDASLTVDALGNRWVNLSDTPVMNLMGSDFVTFTPLESVRVFGIALNDLRIGDISLLDIMKNPNDVRTRVSAWDAQLNDLTPTNLEPIIKDVGGVIKTLAPGTTEIVDELSASVIAVAGNVQSLSRAARDTLSGIADAVENSMLTFQTVSNVKTAVNAVVAALFAIMLVSALWLCFPRLGVLVPRLLLIVCAVVLAAIAGGVAAGNHMIAQQIDAMLVNADAQLTQAVSQFLTGNVGINPLLVGTIKEGIGAHVGMKLSLIPGAPLYPALGAAILAVIATCFLPNRKVVLAKTTA